MFAPTLTLSLALAAGLILGLCRMIRGETTVAAAQPGRGLI